MAFLISEGAVVIDFAGPWGVFSNVMINGRTDWFRLYTVAETLAPIRASGGMRIVPDHALETAPEPKVIVIPAQSDPSEATLDWIRKSSRTADVTMSVCTGAYVLAQTGPLAGKAATRYPSQARGQIRRRRQSRVFRGAFLRNRSGIPSSRALLRLEGGEQVAYDMEYQAHGWMNPDSNAVYASVRTSANNHPFCAVCGMDVDAVNGPKSVYKGKTYYFCSADHKDQFDGAPANFWELVSFKVIHT